MRASSLDRRIRGPDQHVSMPHNAEEHSAVRSLGYHHGRVGRQEFSIQDDVRALSEGRRLLSGAVRKGADLVTKDAGCVYHRAGLYSKVFAR